MASRAATASPGSLRSTRPAWGPGVPMQDPRHLPAPHGLGWPLGSRCRWVGRDMQQLPQPAFPRSSPQPFLEISVTSSPFPVSGGLGQQWMSEHAAHEAWLLHPPFPVGERYQRWLYEPSSGLLGRSLSPLAEGHSSGSPGEQRTSSVWLFFCILFSDPLQQPVAGFLLLVCFTRRFHQRAGGTSYCTCCCAS